MTMLCFLPPLPAGPRQRREPASSPGDASAILGTALVLVGTLAFLFPIGCVRPLPVYAARVGEEARFAPPARDLLRKLEAMQATRGEAPSLPTYFASRDGYGVGTPPGMTVDAESGVVVGTPTMAGSYTVAVGIAGRTTAAITGRAFVVKVLPAS